MIVDFTITNFRSIRTEQTFSLFAEGSKDNLPNNYCMPDGKYTILKSAGIYGANASGKSNLLKAFRALSYLVNETGDLKEDEDIKCYEPFLLDATSKEKPTTFEIEFVLNNVRFIYKVVFSSSEVIEESLWFYPKMVKAKIFERLSGLTWKDITFGNLYKGGKKKFALFANNSYLSKAGNSADSPAIIRDVYRYFRANIFNIDHKRMMTPYPWKDDPSTVANVARILNKVDTGISGIGFKEKAIPDSLEFPRDIPEDIKKGLLSSFAKEIYFEHEGSDGHLVKFSEDQESDGTQRMYQILPMLLDVFQKGRVVIWDELETSFHPHVAELIVKLFNDPEANVNNAQLIFTTHNLQFMNSEFLRRDQIWLSEKAMGQTTFSSLDEFDKSQLKTSSPFSKWYDDGRLGGIPDVDYRAISRVFGSCTKGIENA